MKLCVIAEKESWHFQDLKRAAETRHILSNVSFEQLADNLIHPRHALFDFDVLLCRSMPFGSLQQVVFRMDVLLKLERRGLKIVNPPRAIEMAVDKYLSLTRLQEANISIPPTAVCQQVDQALTFFEELGSDVVVKPLFGSMGRGLHRVRSIETAKPLFEELLGRGEVIYQQAFIHHGDFDLRLLVIGQQVFAMKRINSSNWISNLSQGGVGVPYQASNDECNLALAATEALGAKIAGIDIIQDQQTGKQFVVEANSAPSWKGIAAVLNIDIAREILRYLSSLRNVGNS